MYRLPYTVFFFGCSNQLSLNRRVTSYLVGHLHAPAAYRLDLLRSVKRKWRTKTGQPRSYGGSHFLPSPKRPCIGIRLEDRCVGILMILSVAAFGKTLGSHLKYLGFEQSHKKE